MACSTEPEVPENIIQKDKMSAVLVDIHLLEAKVGNLNLPPDSSKQVFEVLQTEIYEKHGIDSLSYAESIAYYAQYPKVFHDIYEIVVDTLMVRERSKNID